MMESGYFDSEIIGYDSEGMPIFDRAQSSEGFAAFLSYLFSTGILNYKDECFMVALHEGMQVKVKSGIALIQGHYGSDNEDCIITLNTVASGYVRLDRIVIRLNRVDRLVEIVVKEGTAVLESFTPSAPAIIQPDYGDYYELGLATVRIASSQTVITYADITDTRYDSTVCGISEPLVGVIDTSAIFVQLYALMEQYKGSIEAWMSVEESEIMKWFETIKGQLSEDAAINLELMIESLGKEVRENLNAHVNQSILGESGVHGLRFYNDLLQVRDEETQTWFTMVTAPDYKKMTVQIDLTNSNPETCITYADDAIGMSSTDWDTFFSHKPCLFKDGKVVGYLNPDNFTEFEDGTSADITSGDAGDVMIEFPRRGLVIQTVGNVTTVSMTDDPDHEDFEYLSHSRGELRRENFYYGAYEGYVLSSKLRSVSGYYATGNQSMSVFRTQAQANGNGYEMSAFYQVTFIQAMYLLKYKNLSAFNTLGYGQSHTSSVRTGIRNEAGMDYASISNTSKMKIFGIEDFYGNKTEWLEGLTVKMADPPFNGELYTSNTDFNDHGDGYEDQGVIPCSKTGYLSKPYGTSERGFLPEETNGSYSTYYGCNTYLYATSSYTSPAMFGGNASNAVGMFYFYVFLNESTTMKEYLGARLMYL